MVKISCRKSKQSRLMKGRSCTTALLVVVEELRSKLDAKNIVFVVLLDHAIAFHTIDDNILLRELQKKFLFLDGACKLWVYLKDNMSDLLNVKRGICQSSILSPCLSCMFYMKMICLVFW